MGQLFDRLRNYVRSSVSSRSHATDRTWADRMVESDDDELRRIIEELSREGAPASNSSDTRSGRSSYQSRQQPSELPADVVKAHTTLNVPITANTQTIKQTYKAAIARWHPDRHVNAPAEQQTVAQRRAREINDAYATLKKFYSIP